MAIILHYNADFHKTRFTPHIKCSVCGKNIVPSGSEVFTDNWQAFRVSPKNCREEMKVGEEQAPYSKDWCMNMAAKEGDAEIGAGKLAADPQFEQPPMSRERFRQEAFLAAMQGLLASGPHDCDEKGIAHDARLHADALLAELERTR